MDKITGPLAAIFVTVVFVLGWMFSVGDAESRQLILGYFDTIVGFLAGGVTGLAVGGSAGYFRGWTMRGEQQPGVSAGS